MAMEIDAVSYEPPTKTTKTDVHQHPSLYVKLHFTGLFDIQKAQSVIHSEPSKQRDKTPLLFRQMAFNLSFVAITEEEFVAINKSIREILDWEPQKIPYLQLLVKKTRNTPRDIKSLKHVTRFICEPTALLHRDTHCVEQKRRRIRPKSPRNRITSHCVEFLLK